VRLCVLTVCTSIPMLAGMATWAFLAAPHSLGIKTGLSHGVPGCAVNSTLSARSWRGRVMAWCGIPRDSSQPRGCQHECSKWELRAHTLPSTQGCPLQLGCFACMRFSVRRQVGGSGGAVENPWGPLPPFPIQGGTGLPEGNDWEWSQWLPDAVLINLGTNDWCCGQSPPPGFVPEYKFFLRNISSALQENGTTSASWRSIPLFLVSGPVSTLYESAVQETVQWANSVGLNATFIQQSGQLNETR